MLNIMASHLFLEHLTCLFYSCLCRKELKVKPELGDGEGNALDIFFFFHFLGSKCYIHNPNGCIRHSY